MEKYGSLTIKKQGLHGISWRIYSPRMKVENPNFQSGVDDCEAR
jgi:hypothetical protein